MTRHHWSPKALQEQLSKDNWMLLSFAVAKELGMTVTRLWSEITPEEMLGWSAYFGYLNDEQDKAMKRARR